MKIVLVSLVNNDTLFLEFGKILRGEAGLNAYEVWLQNGNSGTIEDYLEYLKQPAIQAASEIMEAEAERVAAEDIRIANELLRQQADIDRNPDIYNITVKKPTPEGVYYTMTDESSIYFAPKEVPTIIRERGLVLTLEVEEGIWENYQFIGHIYQDWDKRTGWRKLAPLTKEELETVLKGGALDQVVRLITVSDTPPPFCVTGDMYYDTAANLLYTATANDVWSNTGKLAEKGKLYYTIDTGVLWYYIPGETMYLFYKNIEGGTY